MEWNGMEWDAFAGRTSLSHLTKPKPKDIDLTCQTNYDYDYDYSSCGGEGGNGEEGPLPAIGAIRAIGPLQCS